MSWGFFGPKRPLRACEATTKRHPNDRADSAERLCDWPISGGLVLMPGMAATSLSQARAGDGSPPARE